MPETQLTVRELQETDIDFIASYWMQAEPAALLAMGADQNKMPSRDQFIHMLQGQLKLPLEQKRSYCLIWEANGSPIGHCNTNPTVFGEEAFMHLHLWHKEVRNRNLGTRLVQLSLRHFFEKLQLKRLFSEPYALNPAPNKTLEKAGFRLEKEYVTTPGSLNFEQPVKRWILTREDFTEQQAHHG